MIITSPFSYSEIKRVPGKTGRHYDVGTERSLPSVTTILSSLKDTTPIDEWKQRVGVEEAEKIIKQSTDVGDQLHLNLENFILNRTPPSGILMAKLLTKLIISNGLSKVTEVWGCEVPLHYPELYAGTADCIGCHQHEEAVIDFKNSLKPKKTEWIGDYFLQMVSYAEAHNILYGTNIRKGVIMMATQTGDYQEWIIKGKEWEHHKDLWYRKLEEYYITYGV